MRFILPIFFLIFSGCNHYGLMVHQQHININSLASTHVGSPDPLHCCPPTGKMVVLEWWIPSMILKCEPRLILHLIFWNFTERTIEYPITSKIGYHTFDLIDEDFITTGGILTYKAEIVTYDGEIYREWKHQLWVELIQMNTSATSLDRNE